ncbi:VPLPA-CTERM sorting domain-containing protein [Pseudomonadota bacterium]
MKIAFLGSFRMVMGAILISLVVGAQAAILPIGQMNITGGTLDTGAGFTQPFDTIGPNTNLVSGYIGNGTLDDPDSIVRIEQFSASPIQTYTAFSNLENSPTPGTLPGGPVPTGQLDTIAGTISMDLSSWFMTWQGNQMNAGTGRNDGITSAFATGTWNPTTGEYAMTWTSQIIGTLSGTSVWELNGTAMPSAVPIPAAAWLFGSGLLGLVGMAKRKKA